MSFYQGQTALITGASGGLGATFAQELAARGMNTILVARSTEKLRALATELTAKYQQRNDVITLDLVPAGSAITLANQIAEMGLQVDLLVNNAGFATYGNFESIELQRDRDQVLLNIATLVDLCHIFIPQMLERKSGSIINLASVVGFQPVPYMTVYAASKAFVLSLSEGLWAEYGDRGIRVIALCPGATDTSFHEVAGQPVPDRISTPEEVVKAGLKALERQQSYVIPGWMNFFLSGIVPRLLPRKMTALVAKGMMKPKR
jgi:uncharacterized protein